jgi:hypothetical protein
VAAWSSTSGDSTTFAPGLGQNGGAVEGDAQDLGVPGFFWSARSPCFPASVGQELSIGFSAQAVSGAAPDCFAGYQFWSDALCTAANGGAIAFPPVVAAPTYTSVVNTVQVTNPGTVAMSLITRCQAESDFRVRVDDALARSVPSAACQRGDETACLLAGRFEVEVDWRTSSDSGEAQVMSFGGQRAENDESVFWWFFGPLNFEMGVKVLAACVPALGDKYWVFVSGLTDQGWTVRVRDTYTDASRTYVNPVGELSETFADTAAFDCP